ncbi:MAG TPA: methylated-DNA--[protein]-cysteine S-methyltransferase [Fimbriimonas sp.]
MRHVRYHDSPIGKLTLVSDGTSLTELWLGGEVEEEESPATVEVLDAAVRQLDEYFGGNRTVFELPLDPAGTPFQKRVWEHLVQIPYGKTTTYGEIALRLGNGGASRAVGLANGRNPIGIVIPCHRVVGANNSLTGYAGGLDRKRTLLDFEASVLRTGPQPMVFIESSLFGSAPAADR